MKILLRFGLGKYAGRGIVNAMFAREKVAGFHIKPPEPKMTPFGRSREGTIVFTLKGKWSLNPCQFGIDQFRSIRNESAGINECIIRKPGFRPRSVCDASVSIIPCLAIDGCKQVPDEEVSPRHLYTIEAL